MYSILVVDDEDRIRKLIRKYAEFEGFRVTEAANGMDAVDKCKENKFDIIIMDVMMPVLDGFSACTEIKKFSSTPMIILSARGEEYDRIHGFENGVDDYVVKPFSPRELMMRVNAIIKRTSNEKFITDNHDVFKTDNLMVDFTSRIVYVNDIKINLSPKEYDLLFYLVRNRNIALSRESLITNVWGYDFYGDDRTLDTHIKLLRKSLGECSNHIVTVRGVGYRFETL